MLENLTPSTLFQTQVGILQHTLPAVLDGAADGIHDARIATRRLRELIPLLDDGPRSIGADDLRARFRRVGRSLGRVRDADVRITLIESLERRIPHAAPTLVLVRQERERERQALLRKLIKRLERLDALRLVDLLAGAYPSPPLIHLSLRRRRWRRTLHSVVADRTQATLAAIEHATGVYFPNRVHSARIAIKRLRYASEIAHETGRADLSAVIRELKKAQDMLGELHDRQDLSDHLAAEASDAAPDTANDRESVALVRQVLDAEVRHLHTRYLERRERVIDACRHLFTLPVTPLVTRESLLAMGALAFSSSVYLARRTRDVH